MRRYHIDPGITITRKEAEALFIHHALMAACFFEQMQDKPAEKLRPLLETKSPFRIAHEPILNFYTNLINAYKG